jgi:Asp-tRNA(Asn)/Glu-tRNA(Gln) amidotransferase A subunit family amidase
MLFHFDAHQFTIDTWYVLTIYNLQSTMNYILNTEHGRNVVEEVCHIVMVLSCQVTLPVARLPAGPIGLSIIGPRGADEALLDLAVALSEGLALEDKYR